MTNASKALAPDATGADVVLFANTDWYLYNFRRSLALAIKARGLRVLLISPEGAYGPRLQALGLRWQPVAMNRRGLRPDKEARFVASLARLLRAERPRLIHNFTIKCAVYGSIAARMAGVRHRVNAITGMGYVFTSADRRARMLAPVVRGLIKVASSGASTRVILQNNEDLNALARLGADAAHLRLIPSSGVDCSRFSPGSRRPLDRSPIKIVYCGRILWDKGIGEFVEAARLLRARGFEFIAAGAPDPGNPATIPEATLRQWENQGLARFIGHVDDMPALLADTDIFVLPSYREGLPRSLIEAGACALPLISTDAPGCRDVIDDARNGLRVPVRDAAALAKAIARLADDPEFARRLGVAARETALHDYDEQKVIDDTLAVYRELLPDLI